MPTEEKQETPGIPLFKILGEGCEHKGDVEMTETMQLSWDRCHGNSNMLLADTSTPLIDLGPMAYLLAAHEVYRVSIMRPAAALDFIRMVREARDSLFRQLTPNPNIVKIWQACANIAQIGDEGDEGDEGDDEGANDGDNGEPTF